MLTVKLECINGHPWSWQSQPILGVGNEAVPAGNLLTSAGILFSGTKFTTMEYFANFINLEFISESTYTDHENDYLFPVAHETWHFERDTLWRTWKDLILKLSGDGRCDSPGFSAKYCTYVMMDMDTGKVVDIQTISVNEVSSSNAMEKEGCRRSLEKLKEHGMEVGILCTDRHGGIAAMLRDEYPAIDHQFDLWHLAKSTTKKLNAKAKKRECQELGAWMPSVRNHLWWAAATCGGDKVELLEKWRSVVYHTTNQHEWGGTQVYNMCAHTPLSEADRLAKKWIESGSPAHEALSDVVNDKSILKGINQVNLFCHTGKTECFNSSLTKFAPKRVHLPYEGMVVRTKLAAIDNNHNTGRAQARVKRKTKHSGPVGSLRFKIVNPKAKKKWIAKPIFEKKSYGYVYDMLAGVLVKKLLNKKGTSTDIFDPPADAMKENIASVANPGKEAVVEAHISRF
ncbi:uncharacterized protein [Amphiura filiformis]|uniref:uncharacterized protein n=1 Tax=Amphiura filiformis TaxID=82378 RepID=UPI003B2132D1